MADFKCGRTEMCEGCTGLNESAQRDVVCSAVGYLVELPYPQRLMESEVKQVIARRMVRIVEDGYVTPSMKSAAFNSANELVENIRSI